MIKYSHEKQKAIRFAINIRGDVQEYAMNLLHIINNAREYPEMIYRVENTPSNKVYVTCNPDDSSAVRDYISQFGDVQYEEEVVRFVISMEYDSKGFEYIYGRDEEDPKDVEFYVEAE